MTTRPRHTLRFWDEQDGATATEYIIMLVLAAMIVLGAVRVLGPMVRAKYQVTSEGIAEIGTDNPVGSARAKAAGSGGSSSGPSKTKGKSSGSGSSSGSSASASSSGSGSGGGSVSGGESQIDVSVNSKRVLKEKESDGPGFNPFFILIALGLVGLLVYVMFANKKG